MLRQIAPDRVALARARKHGESMEHGVTGLHNCVEVAVCEAEVESVARVGAAKALRVVVLCDVVRVAVVVVGQDAAVLDGLDGVERNAHFAVVGDDSGGAVGVAGVTPAAAVMRCMQRTTSRRLQA